MADIATSILEVGSNRLILQDAEARTKINDMYITDTASGAIASFPDGADNVPVKSLTVNIEPVQSGSGDPSPTNVRPISGHTQAVVTRCGKNLLNAQSYSNLNNCTINASGIVTATVDDSRAFSPILQLWLNSTFVGSGTKISNTEFSFTKNSTFNRIVFGHSGATKDVKITYDVSSLKEGQTYTFTEEIVSSSNPISWKNMMIRPASDTDSTFEPYNGQTYTIDLDGTRYGGTLDVTTGVLTVDRVCVEGDDLTWTYGDRWSASVANYNSAPTGNNRSADLMCEKYKTTINASASVIGAFRYAGGIYVYSNDPSNHPTGKFVFHIEPTLSYQLTPNEISTVLGQNNIWADCGDTTVEYRADTKLYIEKLTAPTEDDMIADHAILANTFFMVGNTLYRATTAIASGATITVGTNATKLSLSDALNTLS